MTEFENIIYVSIASGNDLNRGVLSEPMKTIQAGIDKAQGYITDGLAETVDVYVAAGLYEVNSSEDRRIVMANGVSLYGGYKLDFSERNISEYETEVVDLGTTGEIVSGVRYYEGVTASSILDGFTIRGGNTVTNDGWSFAIHIEGASPVISNNRIYAGSSPVTGLSCGVDVFNGGSPVIEDNYIFGGTSSGFNIGIIASTNVAIGIRRNDIYGGTGGDSTGILITTSTADIVSNTIEAGSGALTNGVKIAGTSIATVKSNSINGGSATEWARGVLIYSNNVNVTGNLITGGTSTAALTGIVCQDTDWVIIRNNSIFGGEYTGLSNDDDAIGIQLHAAGAAMIYNNTIAGGLSYYNAAIRVMGGSTPSIENNVLLSYASANGHCIYETDDNGGNVVSIFNNTLFDYSGNTILYETYDNSSYDSRVDVNNLAYASGNWDADPQFVDLDGADNDIATMGDNDWHLSAASPVEVRQGGLDGVLAGWNFISDADDVVRTNLADGPNDVPTNDNAGGWSMGAYEKD
jgi:hypothetical protein